MTEALKESTIIVHDSNLIESGGLSLNACSDHYIIALLHKFSVPKSVRSSCGHP